LTQINAPMDRSLFLVADSSLRTMAMVDAAHYSNVEQLRDGGRITIRALRPQDRDELVAAVSRLSPRSLYRRFFGPRRSFSKAEISYFVDIDFERHVALVATIEERGRPVIIASARYIVVAPGEAEVSFIVADAHQKRGIGARLLRHLAALAREAGISTFVADVLPDNLGMLKVFERSGMRIRRKQEQGSVHLIMQLA
jgi:RimJ/RimL family protein N-acetyltransferase